MTNLNDVLSFIKKRKVAILCSMDGEGYPNAKAMLKPRLIEDGKLYFSTNTSSKRVGQFSQNPKACVYFFRKGLFVYEGVMLTGTVEVLTDAPTKEKIWKKGDTIYYKGGVTDPDYCVLRFSPLTARAYSNLSTHDIDIS